jgi:hypothetical protein
MRANEIHIQKPLQTEAVETVKRNRGKNQSFRLMFLDEARFGTNLLARNTVPKSVVF